MRAPERSRGGKTGAGTLVGVTATIRPVILSGGSGTRLWPLSTRERPKQFLDLVGKTLFDATLERAGAVTDDPRVIVVTGRDQVATVEKALSNSGLDPTVVVEASGRNTAPAVIAAALVSRPEDVLLVLPSDHLITDTSAFLSAVNDAAGIAATGSLVTFGVEPARPETGYGYIQMGEPEGPGFRAVRFKEKPDAEEAARLITDGSHLWNSGMFVFSSAALLEEAEKQVPDILDGVRSSLPEGREGTIALGTGFSAVRSISIDHAILENAANVRVVPLRAGWTDIGSWRTVWESAEHDDDGNSLVGNVIARDVRGSYVRSDSRTIAIAGVEDLVVVETPDVVLVVAKERSQLVRDLATRFEESRTTD
jgi:mannose-1-phosphate guanylyltransferase/mannose-6-phosphate isomerase